MNQEPHTHGLQVEKSYSWKSVKITYGDQNRTVTLARLIPFKKFRVWLNAKNCIWWHDRYLKRVRKTERYVGWLAARLQKLQPAPTPEELNLAEAQAEAQRQRDEALEKMYKSAVKLDPNKTDSTWSAHGNYFLPPSTVVRADRNVTYIWPEGALKEVPEDRM